MGSTDENDWQKVLYQSYQSDIRWAKERGWRVVQGSVILLGALLAAEKSIGGTAWVWAGLAIALTVAAVLYLSDLYRFAAQSRSQVGKVLNANGNPTDKDWWPKQGGNHPWYLALQLVIVAAATTIVMVGLLC